MRGYMCDRCHLTNPGQYDQRDGEYPPKGWTTLSFQSKQLHLCERCGVDFAGWVAAGPSDDAA